MSEAPERLVLELRQGMTFDAWTECRDPRYAKSEPVEYVRADMLQEIFDRYSKAEADLIEELEAKRAEAIKIAEWYDDMMDKHVTETGNPARISDEEGVWHDGPAADMAQKILRGLQKILTELKGETDE